MIKGFEDSINTNLLITGLWAGSFNLGLFLGPTISGFVQGTLGFVVDYVGFRLATVTFIPLYTVVLLGNCIELGKNVNHARANKRQLYKELK